MPEQSYADFVLQISPGDDGYHVRLLASPVGEEEGIFRLPFAPADLLAFWQQVGRAAGRSQELFAAERFGGALFQALFHGDVATALRRSLDSAAQRDQGLRIRLRLGDAPELADLPWELLYDAQDSRFLALSRRTQIVRYLSLPSPPPPLTVEPPLRLLAVIADVADLPPLDVAAEEARLRNAVAPLVDAGRLALTVIADGDLSHWQRHLRREPVHIVHFVGHGYWDGDAIESGIILAGSDGAPRPISARRLGVLLSDHDPLRLVLLNACETGRTIDANVQYNPYPDIARHLIQQRVPAVIAMQHAISDGAALDFASEFYAALADGYAVDAALAEGRKAISLSGNDLEWATPVYYTRSADSHLFAIQSPPAAAAPASKPLKNESRGGVSINIATEGGTIENSNIQFGNISSGDSE